jgi:hypothetical protein
MKVGRAIAAGILGLLFMLFVAADLVLFGVVPLNSVLVTILPGAGLVLGVVLGVIAGGRQQRLVAAATAGAVPAQELPPDEFPPQDFPPPTPPGGVAV